MVRLTLGRLNRMLRRAVGWGAGQGRAAEGTYALYQELERMRTEVAALRRDLLTRQAISGEQARLATAASVQSPTVYVLTAHEFNHRSRGVPIDERLTRGAGDYVFYFFDKAGVPAEFRRPALAEVDINPAIHEAGKRHFAEWSFFLTEYHKPFLKYPCAVISSRFYEKNLRLAGSLDWYLGLFGHYLERYGYGYLPSYDRTFGLIEFRDYHERGYLGTRKEGYDLIQNLYGVRMMADYRYTADLFCNYIAFRGRREFEQYIEYYIPLIRRFFDEDYNQIAPYEGAIVNRTGSFRNEKPLTLLLELISHLFFYARQIPYFGLHYDGFYEVSERAESFRKLLAFD